MCPVLQPDYTSITFSLVTASVLYPTETGFGYGADLHNGSDRGVHFDRAFDLQLKRECQEKYEETHTREDFMRLIGRNYL